MEVAPFTIIRLHNAPYPNGHMRSLPGRVVAGFAVGVRVLGMVYPRHKDRKTESSCKSAFHLAVCNLDVLLCLVLEGAGWHDTRAAWVADKRKQKLQVDFRSCILAGNPSVCPVYILSIGSVCISILPRTSLTP